jgi:hypothetical protein
VIRIQAVVGSPMPMRMPAADFSPPDDPLMAEVEQHACTPLGFRPRAAWEREMAARMGGA